MEIRKFWNRYINRSDPMMWKVLLFLCAMAYLIYQHFIGTDYLYAIPSDVRDQFIMEIQGILRVIHEDGFPMWSFYRGLGQQITVGNPMWLGDPFTLVTVLLAQDNFIYFLGVVAAIKAVLAGLFFYLFLREMGIAPYSRAVISILYAFNGHMLNRGIWLHYATEVVFVALWLWSLERFHRGKKFLLPIAIALLFLSRNAAYIYLYSGLSFFYVLMRTLFDEEFQWHAIGKKFLKFIPYYLIGLGLSAVLILPGVLWILQSNRMDSTQSIFHNLFEVSTPLEIANTVLSMFTVGAWGTFLTNEYSKVILEDPTLYAGILPLLIIPQVFGFKHTSKNKKIVFAIMLGCIGLYYLFPFVRSFCNAFSLAFYKTSSFWSIVFVLVITAYTMSNIENKKEQINTKILKVTTIIFCVIIFSIWFIYADEIKTNTVWFGIIFLLLFACLLYLPIKNKNWIICLLCGIEILGTANGLILNQILYANHYISDFNNLYKSEIPEKLLSKIDRNNFYRINSNLPFSYNWSQYYGYFGTESYVSIQPGTISNFYKLFDIPYPNEAVFPHFFNRIQLNNLISARYYLCDTTISRDIPDGYILIASEGNFELYENKNALPLAYSYSDYVLEEDLENYSGFQKEYLSLQTVILDQEVSGDIAINKKQLQETISEIEPQIIETQNLTEGKLFNIRHMEYTSQNVDPMIILSTKNSQKFENGIYTIQCEITSDVDTGGQIYYWSNATGLLSDQMEIIEISKGTHKYEFSFQLDQQLDGIRFDVGDCEGKFVIKDFKLEGMSSDTEQYLTERRAAALQINKFSQNNIRGTISTEEDSILFFSIPYDAGWTVKANGVKQDILIADGTFMACSLPSGKYEIELSYCTPGLKLGTVITCIALCVYICLLYFEKKKRV